MNKPRPPIDQDTHLPAQVVQDTQDMTNNMRAGGDAVSDERERLMAAKELRKTITEETDAQVAGAQAAGAKIDDDTRQKIGRAVKNQLLRRSNGESPRL